MKHAVNFTLRIKFQVKLIINIIERKNNFNNSHEIALAPQVKIARFVRIFTVIKFHFFIIFGKEMRKVYLISHCCNFCCIQEIEHQKELVVMEQKQTHIKSIKTNLGIRLCTCLDLYLHFVKWNLGLCDKMSCHFQKYFPFKITNLGHSMSSPKEAKKSRRSMRKINLILGLDFQRQKNVFKRKKKKHVFIKNLEVWYFAK